MGENDDLLLQYLHRGSPLIPKLALSFRLKVLIGVAKGIPLALAAAINLRELYLSHFQKIWYNQIYIPRDFPVSYEGLEHYKLGFLVPTVIVQSSIQKQRSTVFSFAKDFGFTNDLVSFILDKIVACDSLREKKALWKEIFQLAYGYENSISYAAGVVAQQNSFISVVGSISS